MGAAPPAQSPTPPPQPVAPEWISEAVDLLNAITGAHAQKKRDTIIALVDARLAGRPEESVWQLPGTVNRKNYHVKWKHDPDFKAALDAVHRLATVYKTNQQVNSLALAAQNLAISSPAAVATAVALLTSQDETVQLRAAFGILDRAGVETAQKGTVQQQMNADQFAQLSQEAAAKAKAINEAAGAAWDPNQPAPDDDTD